MSLNVLNPIWQIGSPVRAAGLAIVLTAIHVSSAQSPTLLPRLTGIVSVDGHEFALLEVTMPYRRQALLLRAGERQEQTEVKSINSKAGMVELTQFGSNRVVALETGPWSGRGVFLTSAALDGALLIYGEMTGFTLLRHPDLPDDKFTLNASAPNVTVAIAAMALMFTNHGIAVVPDGEKFEKIVPLRGADKVTTRPHPPRIREGQINFISAKPDQVAFIYAELAGRKLKPGASIPPMKDFQLVNRNSLTREETVYALDALFAWRGVKLVPVGTNLLDFAPVGGP